MKPYSERWDQHQLDQLNSFPLSSKHKKAVQKLFTEFTSIEFTTLDELHIECQYAH